LLLDEPTNHLDMRAKDVLLEAISGYSGTVVFVSHDRYFIDRLATRVLEIENGAITAYEGNYEDYLRRKAALDAATGETPPISSTVAAPQNRAADAVLYQGAAGVPTQCVGRAQKGASKENGASAPGRNPAGTASNTTLLIEGGYDGPDVAPKKPSRRLNPIKQKQMEDRCRFLEEEIPRVEASIAHTEQQLGVYVSAAETQRLTMLAEELRAQLAALTAEWEELMAQLDGL
jgi:ATP-binding cassette, subfamily F, member 3